MEENQNEKSKEQPKGPVFEFKLPPDGAMPILNNVGAMEDQANFDPHITKKEFNFYLVNNMKPLIGLVYGLIGEVERLRKLEEERNKPKQEGNDVY